MLLGTPQYMAPERWRGDEEIGPESDLFSVGALLFEMLTGRPAYGGRTPLEVLRAIADAPPSLRGDAGVEQLDRIVRAALAREPTDRYPSAGAMSLALSDAREFLGQDSVAVAAPTARCLIVLPFRLLRPDESIDFLSVGIAEALTTSLSGLPSLVLRSPNAVSVPAGQAPDFAAIARQGKVDLVLAGTLLRSGERLRASVQLVDASASTIRWSGTIDATVGDV